MPPVLSGRSSCPRGPIQASALALLLATACSVDRPTEPPDDSRPELAATGCSGVCLRDNFTGFDGTLLENHTPDGEGDPFRWLRGGDPGWNSFARIQDNAVEPADDAFPRYDYFADAGAGLDVVEANIVVLGPVTSQQEVLLYLRATPEVGFIGDGWALRLIIFGNGSTEIDLYKAGNPVTFIQTSDPWAPDSTYHARFEIIGDQVLNFYIDGALSLTYTDGGEPLSPGTVGIGGFRAGPAQVRITSFAAGEAVQQSVNVVCSPSNPVRGDSIHCKAALSVPEQYTVIKRSTQGVDFLIEDLTNSSHEPGDTNTWEGIAVAPSEVTVEVQVGTGAMARNLSNQTPASFGTQARSWPAWQLTTLLSHSKAVIGPRMTEFPLEGTVLGQFVPDYPGASTLPLDRPSGGPNGGLVYLRDPVAVTGYLVNTHPALYRPNNLTPPGSRHWYRDQNGQGSGTCLAPGDVATLAASVERHEGVTQSSNSHFGIANQQFALLQPQMILEEMYSKEDDAMFQIQVDSAFVIFNNTGPYAAAQQNFDNQDVRPTLASANCAFDFNPNDR